MAQKIPGTAGWKLHVQQCLHGGVPGAVAPDAVVVEVGPRRSGPHAADGQPALRFRFARAVRAGAVPCFPFLNPGWQNKIKIKRVISVIDDQIKRI